MKLAQFDAVCEFCNNAQYCRIMCAPLCWVDGDVPRKERLLRNISGIDAVEWQDPKKVLAEIIEDRKQFLDRIILIKDCRLRLIVCGMAAQIPADKIADMLSIHRGHLYKLIQK
jgi:hypothetical protein